MDRTTFKGLGVALVTPFMQNGAIDFAAVARIVDSLVEGGVDYILVLGTTGETPTLSTDERKALIRFVRDRVAGRVALMVGIGGNCTHDVVACLKRWDLSGYNAVLSVNPYYNKPNQEGLYQHFKAIAEASPLPIMLYNIPGRTGVNMTPATIARLANDCATETVTLNNALKTLTLRDTGYINPILLCEHLHSESIAKVHFCHTLEFSHLAFGGSAGLLEVS